MEAFGQFIPLILIFAIMWFLLIRPQQKKMKEHRAMVEALRRGDVDIARWVYVADTDAAARAESEAGIIRHLEHFMGKGTAGYLGIEVDDAIAVAEQIDVRTLK